MDWIMAHPWMTFILLLTAIECASNVVANICRAIVACRDNKDNKPDSTGESNS